MDGLALMFAAIYVELTGHFIITGIFIIIKSVHRFTNNLTANRNFLPEKIIDSFTKNELLDQIRISI